MVFKELSMVDSGNKMDLWKEDSDGYLNKELDNDYSGIRNELINEFNSINTGQRYVQDYRFGLALLQVLEKNEFTVRDAANDNIWRFISLCIIPDIVAKRWGKMAEIRYYKQSARIWLRSIWWYIYLSWQGSAEKTREILHNNTTDQILQLVDRSGSKGYYVDVYRRIMYYYWKAKQINGAVGEEDFRRIMTFHTAICKTIEPGLYENGVEGYVQMLYRRLGVRIDD